MTQPSADAPRIVLLEAEIVRLTELVDALETALGLLAQKEKARSRQKPDQLSQVNKDHPHGEESN